jgi:hypothetical protein
VLLFESYSTQKEIEKLARLLLREIAINTIKSNEFKNARKFNEHGFKIRHISNISFELIQPSKFNLLKDFVKQKLYISFEDINEYGVYIKKNKNHKYIALKYNNDIQDVLNDKLGNYEPKNLFSYLYYIYNSTLIHELQHAYDDYRSNGKYDNIKSSSYINLPYEINSFFTETISELDFIDNGKIIPWDILLYNFKKLYNEWDSIKDKYKRKLIRRLSQYYFKEKEKIS